MTPQEMERIIASAGRTPRQRTTLYGDASPPLRQRSFAAAAARMATESRMHKEPAAAQS